MRVIPQQTMAAAAPRRSALGIAAHVLLYGASLIVGLAAFVAHEHFALQGNSNASLATLVAAGGFAFAPVRALLRAFFAVEGKLLHLAHGICGLSLIGLTLGGGVSGAPLLRPAALAPFEMMGAAQALMHQNHPRNPAEAAALQQFATSLPELATITHGDAMSPANARRAILVLNDILSKAQRLGQTELSADPEFQSALRATATRMTLSLGMDAVQRTIGTLAENPAAARAVPDLQRRVDAVRKTIAQ